LSRDRPEPARHGRVALPPGREHRSREGAAAHRAARACQAGTRAQASAGLADNDADPREEMDSLPGVMWHLSDAWERRSEPNIMLIHYDDLSADLNGQMRRIADQLGITVPEQTWPSLV